MVSSKLPSTTLPRSGVFGVKVTLIGPPTKTYSPGPELMTKRAGDALVKPDRLAADRRPDRPGHRRRATGAISDLKV